MTLIISIETGDIRMLITILALTGFNHWLIDKSAPFAGGSRRGWTMTLINLMHFLQCFLIVGFFVVRIVNARPATTIESLSGNDASGELILVQAIFR